MYSSERPVKRARRSPNARAGGGGEAAALEEGGRVLVHREGPRFGEERREARRPVLDLAVIPRGGGHGGQVGDAGDHVVGLGRAARVVEGLRDQHDAVQAEARPAALEPPRHRRRARGAEALAQQVLGRGPPLVLGDPGLDELGHRVGVLVEAPELLVLVLPEGAAPARAHRVHEHEVGGVEQRQRVVLDQVGRGAIVLGIARHRDPPRAHGPHVQPDRGRAGAAVPEKGQGSGGGVLHRVLGVGEREDGRLRLALVVAQVGLAGGGGVGHRLRSEAAGVSGHEGARGRRGGGGRGGSRHRRGRRRWLGERRRTGQATRGPGARERG